MKTYEEEAPDLSKFVDEATFRADFPADIVPNQAPDVEPSAERKRAVYNHIKARFAEGRRSVEVRRVANDLKVPARFVKRIFEQVKAARAAVHVPLEE